MSEQGKTDRIKMLTQQALSGRIDRRRFMEGALATGMTVAAATAAWTTDVQAATPKKGGTYKLGLDDGNTTDKLDPWTTESTYMIQLNHTCRSWLTEITEDNVVGPEMAESWDASDDASIWTFKIRSGAEFHNGKTVTAKDIRDSLNYHRGDDSQSAAKSLLGDVKEITAVDDSTLKIELSQGSADLPYVMTDYHLVIMPSDGEGNVDWESGVGSGPFQITDHEPGVRTSLTRHPNYWKEGRGHFDAVEILAINDPNARQTAIATGVVDAATEPDLKTVHLLGRNPDLEVDEVASGAHVTIPMFTDVAPFDNNDVRLALKYALDRDEVIDKIANGHASKGNDTPIGPALPYWADIEQRNYDLDKAKFHLKKAGLSELNVELSASDTAFPGAVDFAQLYQQHAAPAGINITPIREPQDGYWSNVWLVKPFVMVAWGARPTPDVMFSLAYSSGAAWNESHFEHERFNQLLGMAKAELDDVKRAEMYREMQIIMRDEGGTIVPYFRNLVYTRRSNVKHGGKLSANWPLDGARSCERWWFA